MKTNPVRIRTIQPKHVEQLPWEHDERFDFSGMTNLGRCAGAMIFQDQHNGLHRVSITVFFHQTAERLEREGLAWKEASQKTREEIAKVPQLFTDDTI